MIQFNSFSDEFVKIAAGNPGKLKGLLIKARRGAKKVIGKPRAADDPRMPGSFFSQGSGIRGAISRLGG